MRVVTRFAAAIAVAAGALLTGAAHAGPPDLPTFPASARPDQIAYEDLLRSTPTAESLQHWHELLCSEPHVAGTPADLREADRIAAAFESMGLQVQRHEIWAYLCRPISAVVEVASPEVIPLGIREEALPEDKYSANPDLMPGWNAYSGSGDITAPIVYANYGTKADFQKLKNLGVDCRGKIILARYGQNFRGYKAKFAQAAGAAGLIIFTDPADSGYCKGIMYPEGGYANDTCIQRGSLNTLDHDGDPLTPFVEATKDAKRLDPATLDLPRIPVQPIGWGAAREILSRMTGPAVPDGWQGGLPFAYRLTGGDSLTIHLKVEQERFIAKTVNVLATLPGSLHPEQKVLIGSHHDAWGYGAADPMAGTITVLESARVFADAAKAGKRPLRSIVFAAWAAEEFGLIGSVEWVEANRDALFKDAVAYINLDMASMGPEFGASASPALRNVIIDSARAVPQPGGKDGQTVYDAWLARGHDPIEPAWPKTGDIGGGSDHVGFNCHLSVSVAGMGGSGSKGTSYHSVYDNLTWYWKVVGADYASATMVTRMTDTIVARLASSPLLPLDPVRPATDTLTHLETLSADGISAGILHTAAPEAAGIGATAPGGGIALELASLQAAASRYQVRARSVHQRMLEAQGAGRLSPDTVEKLNRSLLALDRAWYLPEGLPGRPWFRSLLTATDEDSGYGSWMLPALRRGVEHKDITAVIDATGLYARVFERLAQTLGDMERALDGSTTPDQGSREAK